MGGGGPPPKSGPSTAVIIIIVLVVLVVLGFGGCATCVCLGARSAATSSGGSSSTPTGSEHWITSEHPYVKFIAPPGWTQELKGDWGTFRSTDGAAVFAFTSFTQPGESTVRLGQAASVLGVGEVDWHTPKYGTLGKDGFAARTADGSCNFRGPNGYMWYGTVNTGTSDQILLIYTMSARVTQADKTAILTAINSLQRR